MKKFLRPIGIGFLAAAVTDVSFSQWSFPFSILIALICYSIAAVMVGRRPAIPARALFVATMSTLVVAMCCASYVNPGNWVMWLSVVIAAMAGYLLGAFYRSLAQRVPTRA
ncbi:MAG: hypothetical protein V4649_16650 [Bacteroidota bacterium]